jgi:hypothetical protein
MLRIASRVLLPQQVTGTFTGQVKIHTETLSDWQKKVASTA